MVLCGSNSYNQKYYLDPQFEKLPTQIKEELKILCVLFTEEVGGTITFEYDDDDGELNIVTGCDEGDLLYDDVGAGLLVKKMQNERQEFFESLELYYKIFILHEDITPDDVV